MIRHRVESKRQPQPPPLPKEVEPIGPRAYRDRFGREYDVIWSGQRGDRDLRDLNPNILK